MARELLQVDSRQRANAQREYGSQVVGSYWDPEIAESAITYNIMMNEVGLKRIPEYEPALLNEIENYAAYGMYWLTDKMGRAEKAGYTEEAERIGRRIGAVNDRAAMYGRVVLRLRDKRFDEVLASGWDAVDEVTSARDHEKFRLSNTFARYKAERLITRENDLFY